MKVPVPYRGTSHFCALVWCVWNHYARPELSKETRRNILEQWKADQLNLLIDKNTTMQEAEQLYAEFKERRNQDHERGKIINIQA